MIIDKILDRQDGFGYDARDFYHYCLTARCARSAGIEISRAMDEGTENDVKVALCKYILGNGYNPEICTYVLSQSWL